MSRKETAAAIYVAELALRQREGSAVVERVCDFEDAAHWLRESLRAAWLDKGKHEVSRLILLAVKDLESLCKSSSFNQKASNRLAQRTISDAKAEQQFKAWRAQRGKDIPTEADDIIYMKQFGVSRDRVRALRKKVENRPRGKSKNPPANTRT